MNLMAEKYQVPILIQVRSENITDDERKMMDKNLKNSYLDILKQRKDQNIIYTVAIFEQLDEQLK